MLVDFLIWLAKRNPFVHIPGYMNRWWLVPYTKFPEKWAKRSRLLRWIERKVPAIRLHEILRSDNDRDLHDHPWAFVSVILRGGYYEERPKYDRAGLYIGLTTTFHGPGDILFRRAKDFHRLTLLQETNTINDLTPVPVSCWTLFITFAYAQKWGYLVHPAYKQRYEEYQAAHPSGDPAVQAFRSKEVQKRLGEGYVETHEMTGGTEMRIYPNAKRHDPIVVEMMRYPLPEISPAEYYWRNANRDRRKGDDPRLKFRNRKTD